jgi:hypothetical protein
MGLRGPSWGEGQRKVQKGFLTTLFFSVFRVSYIGVKCPELHQRNI